jgi:hypothetical protein|tara:strand:- start:278 stop:934 length:657 start_codon:yes stop_codon:yes gene_type:complete
MPRHILVFGSTSPAGIAFCLAALRDSHTLTLFVRNATKLPDEVSSNATIVNGQLTDAVALEHAIACGATTCVSFLGPVMNDLKKGEKPIADGYKLIIPMLQKYGYTRTLVLSTASFRVPEDHFTILFSLMVWLVYLFARAAYDEINGFSPLVAQLPTDELGWTIYRVPILRNGETREVAAGYVGKVGLTIERKALAEWLLQEMERKTWIGKCPAVANA